MNKPQKQGEMVRAAQTQISPICSCAMPTASYAIAKEMGGVSR
ncbi:MAG: hypothetical protein AAFO95_08755 [Cyanobacteria bacterium J06600_6]